MRCHSAMVCVLIMNGNGSTKPVGVGLRADEIDEDVALCHETWHQLFLMGSGMCLLAAVVFVSTVSVDNIDADVAGGAPAAADGSAEPKDEKPAAAATAFDGAAPTAEPTKPPQKLLIGTVVGSIIVCIVVMLTLSVTVTEDAPSTTDAPLPPPPPMSCGVEIDDIADMGDKGSDHTSMGTSCIREGMDYGGET